VAKVIWAADEQNGRFLRRRNSLVSLRILRGCTSSNWAILLILATKALSPHGFVGEVHAIDARVGGSCRMSFTNFGTGQSHSFGGTYVELTPRECIRYNDRFDDPNLAGAMEITVRLRAVMCGTGVTIV